MIYIYQLLLKVYNEGQKSPFGFDQTSSGRETVMYLVVFSVDYSSSKYALDEEFSSRESALKIASLLLENETFVRVGKDYGREVFIKTDRITEFLVKEV
ncbi:hypothetical protein CR969_03400 [Candidatus Saccharibacteria bacterium]|nr:MAG: hypothetical protein CR969_03400 [Candidatus Saccharibacteria bacterium]